MLKLGFGIIQLLSSIAPILQLPQSMRACLELHVDCCNISIPGIALILESSPNLETLTIHGCLCCSDTFKLNPSSKNDLDCDLCYLKTVWKTVCFKKFTGEPMLTLTRILLKRAIVLEKMVVDFRVLNASSSTTIFYTLSQELLSYPRFSQKTVIHFCFQ